MNYAVDRLMSQLEPLGAMRLLRELLQLEPPESKMQDYIDQLRHGKWLLQTKQELLRAAQLNHKMKAQTMFTCLTSVKFQDIDSQPKILLFGLVSSHIEANRALQVAKYFSREGLVQLMPEQIAYSIDLSPK